VHLPGGGGVQFGDANGLGKAHVDELGIEAFNTKLEGDVLVGVGAAVAPGLGDQADKLAPGAVCGERVTGG